MNITSMIRPAILSLVGILTHLLGVGQTFPDSLTANHQLVQGTNLYLVPPASFLPSTNFKGFQHSSDQTSMIMVMEIPGPFSEVTKGFRSKEMLKARGMNLTNLTDLKVADFEGMLVELDQSANGLDFSKHLLVYGDDSATTMINGIFLADSVRKGKAIKASLLSAFVDLELEANPRDALAYTINEKAGGLQFHSVIGNGMLFNRDLKTPTESEDKATFLSDRSYAKVDVSDKKALCLARLQQYPDSYSVLEEQGIHNIQIDGLDGYELIAKNNTDEAEEMYQVILFDEAGGYYILVGTYLAGNQQALEDIKKVALTFTRR